MIALVTPAGAGDPANAQATRAEIARMQDDVIAAVDSTDFGVGTRYTSVPALAGVLFSERGLRRVRAHPFVLGVTLDTGGSGHFQLRSPQGTLRALSAPRSSRTFAACPPSPWSHS